MITFNTLVNNARNYFMSGRTNGLGATNTVFAQNIVQGGGEAAGLSGPYTGGVWSGNLIWQNRQSRNRRCDGRLPGRLGRPGWSAAHGTEGPGRG